MKTLIWKEWRETRMIAGAFFLLFVALNVFLMTMQYFDCRFSRLLHTAPSETYTLNGILMTGVACTLLAVVICGGGMVSRESSQGTLTFLTGLPVSKKSIWLVKAGVGFAASCATAAGILATGLALARIVFARSPADLIDHPTLAAWATVSLLALIVYAIIYTVSYAVSSLIDHPFASVVVATLACFGIVGVLFGIGGLATQVLPQKIQAYKDHMISGSEFAFYLPFIQMLGSNGGLRCILWGGLLTLLALAAHVSYASFCSREEARSRRYLIPLRIVSKWTAVYAIIGAATYGLALYAAFHDHRPL